MLLHGADDFINRGLKGEKGRVTVCLMFTIGSFFHCSIYKSALYYYAESGIFVFLFSWIWILIATQLLSQSVSDGATTPLKSLFSYEKEKTEKFLPLPPRIIEKGKNFIL